MVPTQCQASEAEVELTSLQLVGENISRNDYYWAGSQTFIVLLVCLRRTKLTRNATTVFGVLAYICRCIVTKKSVGEQNAATRTQ